MERLWRNLILALALGVAAFVGITVFAGLEELAAAAAGFDYSLIPAILALVSLSYAGRFVRWLYYLRLLGVSVPLGTNAAIFTAGLSMTVSPGKLGEVLKSVFIRQVSGDPVARTAPAVVAERVTDGTGMLLWGLLGALAFSFGPGLLIFFLLFTAFGVAVLRSKRLSMLAERLLSRVPLLRRLVPHLHDFHASSNQLLAARPLTVATVISFLSWGLECTAVYLCSVAAGSESPFLVVVFIFAISSIAGSLSMLPGGIGAAEAGLAVMFVTVAGMARGPAAALTFVIRLATLWYATALGVVGLLVVRALLSGREEAEATK
ncbi:hypothetical protein Rxycam_00913 [Rubrobacter xylanophilus DSM 9941]|nr:hypothetical protein Rxycam_00913 [Rubrobacter xylanophilus DSM 9941]